jgi:hypothetical protein
MNQNDRISHYFDFLESRGLGLTSAVKTVSRWTPKQYGDFVLHSEEAFPYFDRSKWEPTPFDLVSSASLGGGIWPCSSTECRLRRVDELVRFAALYGEKVIVPSPIPFGFPDRFDNMQRVRILDNILILNYYKPLLKAGIVGITPRYYSFCANHLREFKILEQRLVKAAKEIVKPRLDSVEVFFKRISKYQTKIGFKGPEKFFDHSETWLIQPIPVSELKRHRKSTHVYAYLDHILEDVINQQVINTPGYISDRELDFELIESLSNSKVRNVSRAVQAGFSHSLPFIQNVPISALLKLRETEGESFKVYRDALTKTIKSVETKDPLRINELFNDQILPELNKIDLTIKNSRRLLTESITTDLIVSAGFLGIGLFNGWIPPAVSQVLAAVGGYNFVNTTVKEIRKAFREPKEIRDEKFYFLWKVKQLQMPANHFKKKPRLVPP